MVAALMAQGCDTSISESLTLTKAKLETTLAIKTELVIDNMIEAYQEVQELAFEGDFDKAVSNALSNAGESYEPTALINDSLRLKLQVLYHYKQAIHEYALLADEGFTGKQTPFSKCCLGIQNAYKQLGDTTAIKTANSINTYINASRYDENKVTKILLDALRDIWTADIDIWDANLNSSFIEYQYKLNDIPESSFSEEKLQKYVYQPYDGKKNLVETYKLNLIKERRAKLNEFLNKQDNISSALLCLTSAIDEFLKNNTDKNAMLNSLNRVDFLLGKKQLEDKEK